MTCAKKMRVYYKICNVVLHKNLLDLSVKFRATLGLKILSLSTMGCNKKNSTHTSILICDLNSSHSMEMMTQYLQLPSL